MAIRIASMGETAVGAMLVVAILQGELPRRFVEGLLRRSFQAAPQP